MRMTKAVDKRRSGGTAGVAPGGSGALLTAAFVASRYRSSDSGLAVGVGWMECGLVASHWLPWGVYGCMED